MLRRLVRLLVRAVVVLVVLAVVGLAGAILGLATGPGQRLAQTRLVTLLEDATGARIGLGAIRGTVVRSLRLDDVRVRFRRGTALYVRRVRVRWSAWAMLTGVLRIDAVEIDGLRVWATHTADGWGLPSSEEDEEEDHHPERRRALALDVARIALRDARVAVALRDAEPARRLALADVTLDAALRLSPTELRVALQRFSAVPRGIAVTPISASGTATVGTPGPLEVEDVRLETRRTQLSARGRLEPGRRAVARVALHPLAAAEVRALVPQLALLADVRGSASVAGAWNDLGVNAAFDLGPGGKIAVRGAADLAGEPLGYRARVRLDAIDPGAILAGLPAGRLQGVAGADGRGVDAHATGVYRVQLERSALAAQPLERFRLVGAMAGGHHALRARAVVAAGSAAVQGKVVLDPDIAWRAHGRVRVDDLAALVEGVPGRIRTRVEASGRGTAPTSRSVKAHADLDGSIVRGVAIRDGLLAGRLDGQTIVLDTVRIVGPMLAVDGGGRIDLAERHVEARLRATADLAAVTPAPAGGLAGRTTIDATASGPTDAIAAHSSATLTALRSGDHTADRVVVSARADGLGGARPTATARIDVQALRPAGGAPWSGGADVVWQRQDDVDEARLALRAASDGGGLVDATAGAWRRPAYTTIRVERAALAPPGGERWDLAAPARATVGADGVVDVPWLSLGAGAQRVSLWARLEPKGAATAEAVLSQVALAPLCQLGGDVRCGGRAGGRFRLEGTAAAPRLDGTLTVPDLMVNDARYGELGVRTSYAERALTAHAALAYPAAGVLDVDASVPLDLSWDGPRADLRNAPLALRLSADRLDLRFVPALAPSVLRELDGRLTADLQLRGPRDALTPSGTAVLRADRLLLVATGVPWEAVELRLAADAGGIDVQTLSMRAGDGTLRGGGRIGVRAGVPDAIALRVGLENFLAVHQPAYEAALGGSVAIAGTATAPVVTGDVTVERAIVRPALLPTSAPSMRPDPTIEVVGLPAAAEPAPSSAAPDLAASMAVGIAVHIRRDAWIRRGDAQIELAGDLRADKAPGEPVRITGTVRLVRGWYAFQGRRFELQEGTIVFDGASPPDPTFDIVASQRSGQYTVLIQVGGTATHPTLELSSDPPLEQADVLAVLLFGKPASELGKGESQDLQRQAVSLASGYVMPELQASLLETLGLDTLDVGATGVSAGRYVTEDVFISIAQEFGAQTGQSVAVEYSLTPRLSVKGSTSTLGTSAIDLLWHRRY